MEILHEFGCGIHNLVSKVNYARFHGMMTDLGDVSGRMFEDWCWDYMGLAGLSQNYLRSPMDTFKFGRIEQTVRPDQQPKSQLR